MKPQLAIFAWSRHTTLSMSGETSTCSFCLVQTYYIRYQCLGKPQLAVFAWSRYTTLSMSGETSTCSFCLDRSYVVITVWGNLNLQFLPKPVLCCDQSLGKPQLAVVVINVWINYILQFLPKPVLCCDQSLGKPNPNPNLQ